MKFYPKILVAGLLVLGLALPILSAAPLRVLYFTKSSGYEHSAIKRTDGKPSYSENILTKLAATHDWAVTFSKDGSLFSPEYLWRGLTSSCFIPAAISSPSVRMGIRP